MIKNETNRLAKQSKPLSTTTTPSIHQKSTLISTVPIANRIANIDNRVAQPLSKLDIIAKFDEKTKESSTLQSMAAAPAELHEKHDDDEQAHSSNSDEFDNDSGNQSDNNNSYKNGHGNGNGNNSGPVPPKPLPRTSRNNSISSISSDQGAALSVAAAAANDDTVVGGVRPVAKPRTTTASYKVANLFFLKTKHNFNLSFLFTCDCHWHISSIFL